jgi:Uma2 family endonuclease
MLYMVIEYFNAGAPVDIYRRPRAFTELRCTFGGRSTVPDVSVFIWERIPRKENGGIANVFSLAPDWTIEILSPDQSQTKVTKNILHCLKHGTQMGWLIDPEEQSVFVYLFTSCTLRQSLGFSFPGSTWERDPGGSTSRGTRCEFTNSTH